MKYLKIGEKWILGIRLLNRKELSAWLNLKKDQWHLSKAHIHAKSL